MRKSRSLFISLLIVAIMMATAVTVMAQDRDDAPTVVGSSVPEKGPSLPLTPLGIDALLYDNGSLINSAGTGVGGADESVLQTTSLGLNTLGFGHQALNGNRVADDFTVFHAGGWDVSTITFYAYQTGSTTTSTMTGANLRIWDGVPAAVGSNVIWGDTSTNVMTSTTWSNIYRVTETTTGSNVDRPIMMVVIEVNQQLPAGTYWLDWQVDGSLGSGPWAPPVTINGQASTGNGLQSLDDGATFAAALDTGTGTPQQGFPFLIEGQLTAPTDVSFSSFSGDAAGSSLPLVVGLVVLTILAGAIVLRRQVAH
ncbi:MAG: hypothetical protein KDE04_03450 [Anaerolineales bacterium]|nr:hypothetical protein [Anaerolineales bacterium]MCB0030567.1 hypothetical protein [Anaerolineales bacterium]